MYLPAQAKQNGDMIPNGMKTIEKTIANTPSKWLEQAIFCSFLLHVVANLCTGFPVFTQFIVSQLIGRTYQQQVSVLKYANKYYLVT